MKKKNICSLSCCPFCGGEARFVMEWDGMLRAECSQCGCGTPPYAGAAACQERWNHRTDSWISVKDRLPEQPPNIRNSQGQEFAIKRMPCIVSAKLSKYLSKITAACFDFYDPNSFNKLDVTHWRTFPEPPEGE
ncbi:MAG: DUF551 domain-containing protein [Oscillospiraceae bacterium]|nr:DUF551 domain-containing protein [Oscillospiraceae bacterium]